MGDHATADDVMALAERFAIAHSDWMTLGKRGEGRVDARAALESAIAQLVAERDAARQAAAGLREAIRTVVAYDGEHGEVSGAMVDLLDAALDNAVRGLVAERDAARQDAPPRDIGWNEGQLPPNLVAAEVAERWIRQHRPDLRPHPVAVYDAIAEALMPWHADDAALARSGETEDR